MKNLKKVLALVLVVAMMMGIAVSASAFTDKTTYAKNTEAVDVVSMLGIINGYTDGTFKGDKTVTRAEMAKMICYIVAGGSDVGSLYAGANTFTDCANHWAKGYIAYAAKTGIVAGTGKGLFDPNGTVTGAQAAKMLLCALNYDATNEKLVGANWDVNTIAKADEIGLLEDVNAVNMSLPLSRADAAQMMFNALTCTVVKYATGGTTVTTPDGTVVSTGAATAEEVPNKSFDYREGDEAFEVTGTQQLCEKYFKDLKLDDGTPDDFGRPSNKWAIDTKSVTAPKSAKFTYTASTKESVISKDMKDYTVGAVKVQNKPTSGKLTVTDLVTTNGNDDDFACETTASVASVIKALTKNGTAVEIYTSKKAVTDIVVVDTYLAKVSKIAKNADDSDLKDVTFKVYTSKNTTTEKTMKELDSFGYDKDDMVLVNVVDSSVKVVKDATTIKGTAAIQGTDYYTISSTKYTLSEKNLMQGAEGDYTGTYTFYVDSYGYVIGSEVIEAGETDAQYLYLKDIEATQASNFKDGSVKAKVEFLDGTTKTVDLYVKESKIGDHAYKTWNVQKPNGTWINVGDTRTNIDGATVSAVNAITVSDLGGSHFLAYTVNADGQYTLKTLGSYAYEISYTTPDNVTAVYGDYTANTASKMVMIESGKSYTGYKNFPTVDDITKISGKPALVLHGKGSTTIKSMYVLAEESTKEDITFAYAPSAAASYTNADGTYYKFYVDGAIKYYQVANTDALAEKTIYSISLDDDTATLTKIVSGTTVYDGEVRYTIANATVTGVTDSDYFEAKIGEATTATLFYFGYDKDEKTCGVYDLGDDGKTATLSEDDVITVVYITPADGAAHALAVYVAE